MPKLLQGGLIVTETEMFKGDLVIDGQKIVQIAESIDPQGLAGELQIIDVNNKLIMPGVIDPHTHYQLESRQTTTADDFISGSISAACGGVTTFIDYSHQRVGFSLQENIKARIAEATGKAVIDFTLHQNIINFDEQIKNELSEIKELGISSLKIFTTYRREGYLLPKKDWEELFRKSKEIQLLITIHAEDDDLVMRLEEEHLRLGQTSPLMHPEIRPAAAEAMAIADVGKLGLEIGNPLYIVHLSSKAGYLSYLKAKEDGAKIYAETTPHYLLLTRDKLTEPEAQKYIMTPPLRTADDCQALWEGLQREEIQVVATDHCAFSLAQKLQTDNCLAILPGLPGSETMLPLIHHFGVVEGLFDYPQLVRVLSTSAAKIYGLYPEKGSLHIGTDADIVVFDPQKQITLKADLLNSQASYTPFADFKLQGYPVMTFLRGELIARDGKFCGKIGYGKFVAAETSLVFFDEV